MPTPEPNNGNLENETELEMIDNFGLFCTQQMFKNDLDKMKV